MKKYLGQHFLKEEPVAEKIVNGLTQNGNYDYVLEVGSGRGILTKYLMQREDFQLYVVEIDRELVAYLKKKFPQLNNNILLGDFLKLDIKNNFSSSLAIIGNFPYHISSQILFKILACKQQVAEMVGMFQKEVAQRVVSSPGSKKYGILSVLVQQFYHVEYLFDVDKQCFSPPPKVQSGVIRLIRKNTINLDCDEQLFFKVVKATFNQRRKKIRNSIKVLIREEIEFDNDLFDKRPEQLSGEQFVELTKIVTI